MYIQYELHCVLCSEGVTCPPNFTTTDNNMAKMNMAGDSSGSGNGNEMTTKAINTSTVSISSKVIMLCVELTMSTLSIIASTPSSSKSIGYIK